MGQRNEKNGKRKEGIRRLRLPRPARRLLLRLNRMKSRSKRIDHSGTEPGRLRVQNWQLKIEILNWHNCLM
ncbi:hypothetical protein OUZ56_024116 [Daphnia magna]|uniref:Uncharacterized protein n=1 Tax=Daphnia magna TaxID=35525 RepID=A0ABR0B072_9CRUS|nr:hypothetical protein OUZ56_024116 [Daphnia magna]